MGDRERRLAEMEERGYTIIENAISPETVERLRNELERLYARQAEITGKAWGPERGLENLTNKSPLLLDTLEATRPVLELMEAILGPNLVLASLNARSSQAYTPGQGLHRDHQGQLFYQRAADGRLVTAQIYMQSLWILDDLTPENGATRIVPGTHTVEAGNPRADSPYGGPIPLLAPAGAVAVFPASLWHAGGEHTGPGVRRVFHGFFSRPWAMPQFDNLRSMPQELLERCTPFQRQLLGYDRQASWEEGWANWRRAEVPGSPSKGLWEQ
jgi:ectoine hydroxylase-related dioxygenase (phytanoyl-CoA dioxygenase family)